MLERIGEGGMGCVYRAEHQRLGRQVAVKVLHSGRASSPRAVTRFFREARVVNQIRHGNIVDIADFVELDDGTAFIVMELLEGLSLRELYRDSGPLEPDSLIEMMLQVCDALEATHDIGVVHRDLKPANIFVCDRDRSGNWVKLLDFGVAKLDDGQHLEPEQALVTGEGAVLGTPAYMAPEQARGLGVDARSDVYALGAIMYELLAGERPFVAKSVGDYIHQHISVEPVPLRERAPARDLPARLEAIVMRCLRKDPGDRYQDVAALRRDLVAVRDTLGAPPVGAVVGRRRPWLAAALALAVAGGLAAYLAFADSGTGLAKSSDVPMKKSTPSEVAAQVDVPAVEPSGVVEARDAETPDDDAPAADGPSAGAEPRSAESPPPVPAASKRARGKRRGHTRRTRRPTTVKVVPPAATTSEQPATATDEPPPTSVPPASPPARPIDPSTTFNPYD